MAFLHFLDNNWVAEEELKVSAFDISVLRGYGIFDFFRTYNKKPYRLDDNVNRFFRSAEIIEMDLPYSKEEIQSFLLEGIGKNKDESDEFTIRIVATGGVGADSTTPGRPTVLIIYSGLQEYPQAFYTQGVKVITFNTKRVMPAAKSINYMMGIVATKKAREANAVEAILFDDEGKLYEGTTSNFYAVLDGVVYTAKDEILEGITRKTIMEIINRLQIPLKVEFVNISQMKDFDEAFMSAANKEVMPVRQIDDIMVKYSPGPITQKIMEEFRKITRG